MMFRHTMKSAAWKATSVGARALFLHLQSNHNTNSQNAVFASNRTGATALGVNKDTVSKWRRELEHYGFIVAIRGPSLGSDGCGKAALYRLTDRWYAGKPPTYEFQNWTGEIFTDEKQNPDRKSRSPRPKKPVIREDARMSLNGNKCPTDPVIRAEEECPKNPVVTSFTISLESVADSPWYPENWTSQIIEGVAPHPIDIENGEADSPLWVDAWLAQIPVPTLSLSEIRASMGYRQ
jgi:hypothetical protein